MVINYSATDKNYSQIQCTFKFLINSQETRVRNVLSGFKKLCKIIGGLEIV